MLSQRFRYLLPYTVALLWSATAMISCGEDKDKLVSLEDGKNILSAEVRDLEVVYTEYGKAKTLLKSPLLERYLFSDEPYSVFPNGFFVQLFDAEAQLESQITADYALYKEKPTELWKAVGNVVVINFQKNETLTADTLYWNRPTKTIYTNSPVFIKTDDGIIKGRYGMTSDEQFSHYEIRGVGDSSYYYYTEQQPVSDSAAVEPAQLAVQEPTGIREKPQALPKKPLSPQEQASTITRKQPRNMENKQPRKLDWNNDLQLIAPDSSGKRK